MLTLIFIIFKGMSKVVLTAVTPALQRKIDNARPGEDIIINSCCPGFVDTDMNNHMGRLTIDQGKLFKLII